MSFRDQYATVLPAFAELYAGGMNFDEALDEAIYKVNNISRKKLLGDIDTIYDFLTETMPAGTPRVGKKIPFLKQLASQSRLSTEKSKKTLKAHICHIVAHLLSGH